MLTAECSEEQRAQGAGRRAKGAGQVSRVNDMWRPPLKGEGGCSDNGHYGATAGR